MVTVAREAWCRASVTMREPFCPPRPKELLSTASWGVSSPRDDIEGRRWDGAVFHTEDGYECLDRAGSATGMAECRTRQSRGPAPDRRPVSVRSPAQRARHRTARVQHGVRGALTRSQRQLTRPQDQGLQPSPTPAGSSWRTRARPAGICSSAPPSPTARTPPGSRCSRSDACHKGRRAGHVEIDAHGPTSPYSGTPEQRALPCKPSPRDAPDRYNDTVTAPCGHGTRCGESWKWSVPPRSRPGNGSTSGAT